MFLSLSVFFCFLASKLPGDQDSPIHPSFVVTEEVKERDPSAIIPSECDGMCARKAPLTPSGSPAHLPQGTEVLLYCLSAFRQCPPSLTGTGPWAACRGRQQAEGCRCQTSFAPQFACSRGNPTQICCMTWNCPCLGVSVASICKVVGAGRAVWVLHERHGFQKV